MKELTALLALLFCMSAQAMSPEYFSSRKWVEQQCVTNTTPISERIFIGRVVPQKYASIIRYHQNITLREIIDQTPFKGTNVVVCVLRPKVDPGTNIIKVKPSDKPKFKINALDMIWIYEDGPVLW